ncbi:MAG: RluA family pseudouridine synthase [Chloroflexi bacterium]|nr:MAG: RluA family pseudouridine synthase [Chloroflexota bacterium]
MTTEAARRFTATRRDRLDRLIAEAVPELSRSQAQRLIERGHVQVAGAQATRAALLIEIDTDVEVTLPHNEIDEAAAMVPMEIIYEDEHVLVVNKPAGILVHAVPGVPGLSIVDVMRARYPEARDLREGDYRAGVVHRLDRDTTGVLAYAKTDIARDTLKDQWRARETEKHYVTIVEGRVEPIAGIVDAELGPDPNDGRRRAVVEEGENAYSEYRVREQYGNDHALLDVEIRTGRTHQIRVHLEAIGYPVMGDSLYGKRSEYIGRQALHAAKLGFRLPSTGEYRAFDAPIPTDMQRVIDTLRTQYTDDSKGPQQ